MSSNQSLLAKADVALSDLSSADGILPNDKALQFIRRLIVQPTILKDVRTVGMGAPTRVINRIAFGSRILHTVAANTALSSGNRSKPTFDSLQLIAQQYKAEIRIPYEVMEDNIEHATAANNEAMNSGPGGLRDTILAMIADRAASDIEEIALLGDTASGDADLAAQDGWIKRADTSGNVVNYSNAAISKGLFKAGKKAVPDQYLRNMSTMRHYVSVDQETEYRDTLANRATSLGDNMIQGVDAIRVFGAPVTACAHMPDAKGLFCNPQNLVFGVWRRISLEFDKEITAGTYIIVLSTRMAFQIDEPEAVVEYKNIG